MNSGIDEISHVSDTALLVAAARAVETARPDAMVRDPFAARLAGDRGAAILQTVESSTMLCFGVAIRSRFLDELLLEMIGAGEVDTVLILGAGLDTRPWRLDLPPRLRWIEVDFPEMLDYKAGLLTEEPHCRLERVPADLRDPAARAAVFARAGERTALITEGLLMYLPGAAVEAIAAEAARAGIRRWLMDLTSPEMAERVRLNSCQGVQSVRAADCLNGFQTRDVLREQGWNSLRMRSYISDVLAAVPERVMAIVQARIAAGGPPVAPPPADHLSGVHVFAR